MRSLIDRRRLLAHPQLPETGPPELAVTRDVASRILMALAALGAVPLTGRVVPDEQSH
jgi:hypothetical protein